MHVVISKTMLLAVGHVDSEWVSARFSDILYARPCNDFQFLANAGVLPMQTNSVGDM
jgi:hypothetical protein